MSSIQSVESRMEEGIRLACSELGKRLRSREPVCAEQYLEKLPEARDYPDLVLELLYTEFVVREEMGESVRPEDWYVRFPTWKKDLQELFEVHQQVCSHDTRRNSSTLDAKLDFKAQPNASSIRSESASKMVGNYQLLEEIGRGGMGVVYRARQTNLNREVAVKMILSGDFASPRELLRFQTEAEAAAKLQHPNIVQIFEVGSEQLCPYLSMELVTGSPLDSRIKKSLPTPRQTAKWMEKIAIAIQHAHDQGIVHRDLKPSNVLLTQADEPKIVDFGLARVIAGGNPNLSHSGAIVGTPCYMAPESFDSKIAPIGPSSDVYSLGVLTYEMLTGRPPLIAESPIETLQRVLNEDPVPPSSLRSKIPRDLETICLKCLEKHPHRRYQSAQELADDLGRFLRDEPIRAKSVSAIERILKWGRRRPLQASFLATLILSLVATSMLWRYAETSRQAARSEAIIANDMRETAVAERQKSERSLYFRLIGQAAAEQQANMIGRARQLLAECNTDLRHFEWHYLSKLCNSSLRSLRGHTSHIASMDHSLDRKTIVSGTGQWGIAKPGEIIVWDSASGKMRTRIPAAHYGPIMALAVTPDGSMFASASIPWEYSKSDGIKIWSQDGELLYTLPSTVTDSTALKFSSNGKLLAIGGAGKIHLWNMEKKKFVGELLGHKGMIFEIAFDLLSERLASVGRDGSAHVYDVATLSEVHAFTGFGDLRQVTFSPDGRYLAFSNFGNGVMIWDRLDPPTKLARYSYRLQNITEFAFSPEGRRAVIGSLDGSVVIIDAGSGDELAVLRPHNGPISAAHFTADGRQVVSAGVDGIIQFSDARTDWDSTIVDVSKQTNMGSFNRILLSKDGKEAVLTSGFNYGKHGQGEKQLMVMDLESKKLKHVFKGHTDWLTDAAISRTGLTYASASRDKTVRLWNVDGSSSHVLKHDSPVSSVVFSSQDDSVLTGCYDGKVSIWDANTGQLKSSFSAHADRIHRMAFHPFKNEFVTASEDSTAVVWDAATQQSCTSLNGHLSGVNCVAYSHSGDTIATGGNDHQVLLWNSGTGEQMSKTLGHNFSVNDVCFSSDDKRVLTVGRDRFLRIWDALTGDESLSLRTSTVIEAVAIEPTSRLVIATQSRWLRLWSCDPLDDTDCDKAFVNANIAWVAKNARENRRKGLRSSSQYYYSKLAEFDAIAPTDFNRRAGALAQIGEYRKAIPLFLKYACHLPHRLRAVFGGRTD